ncbi:hypothetical protein, partial [Brevibacillus centrosporus]|uniref:hypothetical protein n=1 Tax=Brevibacillus centrosporus TaxID=54910 RepID=UPI002E1E3BA4|nr:hypothetical protein [Brevibacillus centrosporus]
FSFQRALLVIRPKGDLFILSHQQLGLQEVFFTIFRRSAATRTNITNLHPNSQVLFLIFVEMFSTTIKNKKQNLNISETNKTVNKKRIGKHQLFHTIP